MTPRQRNFFFFFFFFLFLIVSPSLILFSLGYRIDFKRKKIAQTGGIFVKAVPKEVEVFVDGKFVAKTDPLFGSVLIENLLPGKHKVKVEKEGFFPWEKELEVKEKQVTEIKNLVLFPKNLKFWPLFQNIKSFWLSPDGKKLILKEGTNENWSLKLLSLEKKVKTHLLSQEDFLARANVISVEFKNSNEIEVLLDFGGTPKKFLINLRDKTTKETKEELPKNFLWRKEKDEKECFLESSGFLFCENEKINRLSFFPKKDSHLDFEILKDNFLLREDKILYQLNKDSGAFEKIFDGINGIQRSPDSKNLAIFSDFEIWLLKESGEILFLNRFSEKISNLQWLNSNYLIFSVGKKIKVSEIDLRDKVNVFDLKENFEGSFAFSQFEKRIYALENETLFFSDLLDVF